METWSKEEMSALFLRMCKVKLPAFLRELRVTEEDSQSSLMQLFKKKKEVQEMEKVMAEKEEAFRERMKVIADRWRDLHTRRAQLKAHVERSGSAVQKCEELRIQALKIDRKQREENIKMDGELVRVKMELETLRKKHRKLCKKVQNYSIFKKYLEDVVEVSQFEDISEVISQYMLLVRTRKDLLQSQQGHKQLTEQDKVFLEQYKAQKEAEMLQYQNELGQLKLRIYQAQSDIPLWEAHWADIQDRTSKKTGKLWTIKLAIHNLFQSTNLRLQAQWSVLECTSCRQLSMVKPSQKEEQYSSLSKTLKTSSSMQEMQKQPEGCYTFEDKRTWQHDLSCQ
ncbi:coiled-coil domain-containing protein 42-like [Molothrus aeneus]|nr:coiled-coil domain-containing protein 42-like [Molothrus ater]